MHLLTKTVHFSQYSHKNVTNWNVFFESCVLVYRSNVNQIKQLYKWTT